MNIQKFLCQEIKKICIKMGGDQNFNPVIRNNNQKNNMDYQSNGVIKLAKYLNYNPYKFSKKIISKINNPDIYESLTVSKSGFINIKFSKTWLCKKINYLFFAQKINIKNISKKTIVIDYSSPNIAKEMHIGHLRSTILGDVFVRIFQFLGYNIIKQNHIGDCGIQLGILISGIQNTPKKKNIDYEKLYQKSYKKFLENEDFHKKTVKYTNLIQKKDQKYLKLWKKLVYQSIEKNQKIYKILNVKLKNKDIRGESFYYPMLSNIMKDLLKKKIAFKKNKSIIVYTDLFKNRTGKKMGIILKNEEGSYLYAATDIACLKYRYNILKADRIIYCTDIRQKQHFIQIFEIAKKAKYIPKNYILEHYTFGMILGINNKPFKTRDGTTIKLKNLLKESIYRSKKIIKNKELKLKNKELKIISRNIGIGAIKYYDLSKNRSTNYIFNWEKMLSLEGNTSLYIQYAYTRIRTIIKKSKISKKKLFEKIKINNNYERKLILKILQFEEILYTVSKKGMPHFLCNYLYELSGIFTYFYEKCPILFIKKETIKIIRLKLLILTSRIIKKGLEILGIKTVEKM